MMISKLIIVFLLITKTASIKTWMSKMISDWKPARVTLYAEMTNYNDTRFNVSHQSVVKNLVSQVPTVIINLDNLPPFVTNMFQ